MGRIAAFLLLLVGSVSGSTLTLQHGVTQYGHTNASPIIENIDDFSFAAGEYLYVKDQSISQFAAIRALIQFDSLGSAPQFDADSNTTVDSAYLILKRFAPTGPDASDWTGNVTVYAARVMESWRWVGYFIVGSDTTWGENGFGGEFWRHGTPTWYFCDTIATEEDPGIWVETQWTNVGCGTPTSRSATNMDTISVGTTPYVWDTLRLAASVVEDWTDLGDNYGVLLFTPETAADSTNAAKQRAWYSPYHADDTTHPKLVVFYTTDPVCGSPIEITGLPYTCSVSDTCYVVRDDLYSAGNGIALAAYVHDITIYGSDPANDSIYWDTAGTASTFALNPANRNYNITVRDLNFVQDIRVAARLLDSYDVSANAIRVGTLSHDITIEDCYIRTQGRNSQSWWSSGGNNFYLRNITFDNRTEALDDRQQFALYAMVVFSNCDDKTTLNGIPFAYHAKIDKCSTIAAPWVNYYFEGVNGKFWLDSSYIYLDAYNTRTGDGTYTNAEQCYGVAIRNGDGTLVGTNAKITNNTFRVGDTHWGGDGIFMTGRGVDTTEEGAYWIYGNDIITHKGWAGAYHSSTAIKGRETIANLVIRNNDIRIYGDINDSDSSYTGDAEAIRIEQFNYGLTHPVIIDSNTIVSLFRDIGTASVLASDYPTAAIGIEINVNGVLGSGTLWDSAYAGGLRIRDNDITAGTACIVFGQHYNDMCSRRAYLSDNTFSLSDSGTTPQYTFWGYNDGAAYDNTDNHIVDGIYDTASDATPTNITGSLAGSIYIDRSVVIHVVDSTGADYEGARVRISNLRNGVAGVALLTDTTDASGLIPATTVSLNYDHWGTTSPNGIDTAYTFKIDVISDLTAIPPDSVTETQTWYWHTDTVTIICATTTPTADYVEHTLTMGAGTPTMQDYMQGIPREHISASEIDSEMVMVLIANPIGKASIRKYTDHMATLADSAGTTTNYLGSHVHHTMRGDTLNISTPIGTTGKRTFRYDLSPSIQLLNTVDVDSAGMSDSQGDIELAGTGDNLKMIGRNPDAMTMWGWNSANRGQTWTNVGQIYNYNRNIRMDLDRFGTDSLVAFIFDAVFYRYQWHLWNGSAWSGPSTIYDGGSEVTRLYAAEVGKDKIMHIAWSDLATPSHLVHAWRDPNTNVWTLDTIYTASQALSVGNEIWVAMSYSENGEALRIMYSTATTSAQNAVVTRKWNYLNNTWGDPLTLSDPSATSVTGLAGSRTIPSNHNGRGYFAFTEQVGGLWYWRLITLLGGASNQTPVVSGIADQTISEGSSFTAINLDGYVTDPDNSDAQIDWLAYSPDGLQAIISSVTIDSVVGIGWRATPVLVNADSSGCDTIIFTATDPTDLWDEDTAIFTITAVNDAPVVAGIPDQTITQGSNFAWVALYAYVTDIDNDVANEITWTYAGQGELIIDTVAASPLVISIASPTAVWTGAQTITFTATDTGALADNDAAIYTVNAAPLGWHKIKGLKRGHKP